MNERVKTTFWLIAYAFAAGTLLSLFAVLGGIIKYLFSLLALYLGFRFFRKYDSIALRILFVVVSIVFYFLSTVVMVTVNYVRDNPDLFVQ